MIVVGGRIGPAHDVGQLSLWGGKLGCFFFCKGMVVEEVCSGEGLEEVCSGEGLEVGRVRNYY